METVRRMKAVGEDIKKIAEYTGLSSRHRKAKDRLAQKLRRGMSPPKAKLK